MELFDTHCHYNLEPLQKNWREHWNRAQKNSITHSVVVGTDAHSSKLALEIAALAPNLFASVGYHPSYFLEHVEQFLTEQTVHSKNCESHLETIFSTLQELLTRNPIAVGEIGLDFYRLRTKGLKRDTIVDLQKEALRLQLSLAASHNKPVILHVRDQESRTQETAYKQVLTILTDHVPTKFVLHCASGPLDYIQSALEMGAYIGFDGNLTYDSADHLRNIFAVTPADKILLETDAPYLAPKIHKNDVCEPWMITETAHYLRDELHADLEQIYQNSILFFDIEKNHIQ